MSPVLTVEQVITGQDNPPRAWNSTKGGAMLAHKVIFREHPGREVEWSRRQSSDAPVPGQQVEGTIDWQHQYGARFKMDAAPSSGGGKDTWKPHDPRTQAVIQRQAEQNRAIQFLAQTKTLADMDAFSDGDEGVRLALNLVFRVADAFHKDSERAGDRVTQSTPEPVQQQQRQQPVVRKDIERTGQSDVPGDGAEFTHPTPSPAPDEDPIPW